MTKQRSASSSSKASSKPSSLNKQSIINFPPSSIQLSRDESKSGDDHSIIPNSVNQEMKENVSPQTASNNRLENNHQDINAATCFESSALAKRKVLTMTSEMLPEDSDSALLDPSARPSSTKKMKRKKEEENDNKKQRVPSSAPTLSQFNGHVVSSIHLQQGSSSSHTGTSSKKNSKKQSNNSSQEENLKPSGLTPSESVNWYPWTYDEDITIMLKSSSNDSKKWSQLARDFNTNNPERNRDRSVIRERWRVLKSLVENAVKENHTCIVKLPKRVCSFSGNIESIKVMKVRVTMNSNDSLIKDVKIHSQITRNVGDMDCIQPTDVPLEALTPITPPSQVDCLKMVEELNKFKDEFDEDLSDRSKSALDRNQRFDFVENPKLIENEFEETLSTLPRNGEGIFSAFLRCGVYGSFKQLAAHLGLKSRTITVMSSVTVHQSKYLLIKHLHRGINIDTNPYSLHGRYFVKFMKLHASCDFDKLIISDMLSDLIRTNFDVKYYRYSTVDAYAYLLHRGVTQWPPVNIVRQLHYEAYKKECVKRDICSCCHDRPVSDYQRQVTSLCLECSAEDMFRGFIVFEKVSVNDSIMYIPSREGKELIKSEVIHLKKERIEYLEENSVQLKKKVTSFSTHHAHLTHKLVGPVPNYFNFGYMPACGIETISPQKIQDHLSIFDRSMSYIQSDGTAIPVESKVELPSHNIENYFNAVSTPSQNPTANKWAPNKRAQEWVRSHVPLVCPIFLTKIQHNSKLCFDHTERDGKCIPRGILTNEANIVVGFIQQLFRCCGENYDKTRQVFNQCLEWVIDCERRTDRFLIFSSSDRRLIKELWKSTTPLPLQEIVDMMKETTMGEMVQAFEGRENVMEECETKEEDDFVDPEMGLNEYEDEEDDLIDSKEDTKDDTKPSQVECEVCGACMVSTSLQKHLAKHAMVSKIFKMYRCAICDECFEINLNLEKHNKTYHKKTGNLKKVVND